MPSRASSSVVTAPTLTPRGTPPSPTLPAVRTLGGIVVSIAALTMVGCTSTPEAAPDGEATTTRTPPELPAFSVAQLLGEVPASVRTARAFELRVGDLAAASRLAGVDRPSDPEDAAAWLSSLIGVGEGGRVFVPLAVPLAPSAPAAMVREDLGWSVLDVERFVSWTSRNAVTTVVAGDVGEAALAHLPEAGGIHSAGEGADLEDGLEKATPARPSGVPMRMAAEDPWLVSSPYTSVVDEWRSGASTLADDAVLAGMAEILDARGAYAAYAATPFPAELDRMPQGIVDGLGLTPQSFPDFDTFAIGWAGSGGDPAVTVVYHDADGRDVGATAALVEERWVSYSQRGRSMRDLVAVDRVTTEGDDVVVDLRPRAGYPAHLMEAMVLSEELPFRAR